MNIKTPVKTGCYNGCTIHNGHGNQIACAVTIELAAELAAIINLHAELVQFVKHISERAGIESVERHQAYDLLAKCE